MYSRDQFVESFGIYPSVCQQSGMDCRGTTSREVSLTTGNRHDIILGIGSLLRRRGATKEDIEIVLKAVNYGAFAVPEDDAEVCYQARYCDTIFPTCGRLHME